MISEQEKRLLVTLGDVWNEFCRMERQHPDEGVEFRRAIHAAQTIIMARATARGEPGFFVIEEEVA